MSENEIVPTPHYSEAVDCAYKIIDVINAYKATVGLPLTPAENPVRIQGIVNGVLKYWDNPKIGARENHMNWFTQMREDGWGYGEVLDEKELTHPAFVAEYDDVPPLYKVNDQIFMAIATHFKPQSQ